MNFINTLKDIWKIEELKEKLLLTLGLIAVYRFMAAVPLPGIDPTQLAALKDSTDGGLLGLLNAFTGGAFARASVMALGIMPYISASIVVQLMGIAVPYLQKLQKDGESGRKKITQITRWLTIAITLFQAPTYIGVIQNQMGLPQEAFLVTGATFWISSIILLSAGTIFAMWLGERITDKGVGNGISLLITVGIIANFPAAFIQELVSKQTAGAGGIMMILIELIVWFVVILLTVLLVTAVRKVAVQYARRTAVTNIKDVDGARQYIPLKLNAAGVMPIIFAQAIMFLPIALGQKYPALNSLTDNFGLWYNVIFALLIIVFSYFYTAITIPTNKMAEDLKRSNGFVPGYKPGEETANFLDSVLSKITLPGSIFLAALSILPAIVVKFGVTQNWAMFYGGTSLIIMVGVAIDTIQQINSYLLNSRYDGLMKTGNSNRKSLK
ncbi:MULTISPECIES: preprotein translocase subunit SecY [Tenacibaculum]|uniref:Protein translocase subunit SecY n=1 Tax=Tenacibaculum discolor TaxID=361581 RepID=A0A2G1BUB4_9FLAO|nr:MULTISPECIES: preprotein translocase subunit SecY [Tenacibaculum]PHO01025.1 preprotein translocase subunit SecY [Rhodobacteraceae bacterium 4F10]MDP2541997.1 preprotein translocase subunit SecY [Tenacibaculum discolor]NVK08444.1 preprotein translocase subunit SecY [Tenacibaculum sp.]PHN97588.1 preprotein translocase subunit SecY [Tenacibaculum discolor]RLK06635.1 protein translocase subunit secY/sec61 alpha [Tenacibaculum discolor]